MMTADRGLATAIPLPLDAPGRERAEATFARLSLAGYHLLAVAHKLVSPDQDVVIRTAGNPFRSRPSLALILSVAGSVLAGLIVVISPFGRALGFGLLAPALPGWPPAATRR